MSDDLEREKARLVCFEMLAADPFVQKLTEPLLKDPDDEALREKIYQGVCLMGAHFGLEISEVPRLVHLAQTNLLESIVFDE